MNKQEIFGTITELKGYRALVTVKNKDGTSEALDALNHVNAKLANKVRIVWRETPRAVDIGMIVGPPLLCLVAGGIFGYRAALYFKQPVEMITVASIVLWLLLGVSYSFRYWRYAYARGRQPVVDKIMQ